MNPLRTVLLAGGLLLTGCATTVAPPPAARDRIADFALEARFALRVSHPDRAPENSGGRLSWEHRRTGDHILIANPLGIGLAEIDVAPGLARLRTANGEQRESTDADALIADVTGQALPVDRLPAWLLGRAKPGTPVETDAAGRPGRFHEAGWQIEYGYDTTDADALPARLTLNLDRLVELRLRIEQWKDNP